MQIFQNEEFGSIRTIEENGQIWFCGSDVASALGYSNPWDAVKRHCKRDGVVKREGVSFTQNQYGKVTEQVMKMNFISEPNLYRLVCNSKLKSAERFEKWVFEEVLPMIRKTGSYNNGNVYGLDTRQISLIVAEVVKELVPIITKSVMNIDDKQVNKRKRRTHNRFDSFPAEIRIAAERMYYEGNATNEVIAEFCCNNGCVISKSSVQRYFTRED